MIQKDQAGMLRASLDSSGAGLCVGLAHPEELAEAFRLSALADAIKASCSISGIWYIPVQASQTTRTLPLTLQRTLGGALPTSQFRKQGVPSVSFQ